MFSAATFVVLDEEGDPSRFPAEYIYSTEAFRRAQAGNHTDMTKRFRTLSAPHRAEKDC